MLVKKESSDQLQPKKVCVLNSWLTLAESMVVSTIIWVLSIQCFGSLGRLELALARQRLETTECRPTDSRLELESGKSLLWRLLEQSGDLGDSRGDVRLLGDLSFPGLSRCAPSLCLANKAALYLKALESYTCARSVTGVVEAPARGDVTRYGMIAAVGE